MSKEKVKPEDMIDNKRKEQLTPREKVAEGFYWVQRVVVILATVLMFFPGANPAKIVSLINKNISLFTTAIAWDNLTNGLGRAFQKGWLPESIIHWLQFAAILVLIGIICAVAAGCMSIGNRKFRKLSNPIAIASSVFGGIGLYLVYQAYVNVCNFANLDKVEPNFPSTFWMFLGFFAVILITGIAGLILTPKVEKGMKYHMEAKYKLFLMFLPFAALCFIFAYLPLYGWRYAFFNYKAGGELTSDNFVGFYWFTSLFQNEQTRMDILRVLRNTLVMSGLGILTSWIPLAFAIFLNEIKNTHFRRIVQTFTTIPNFISWVMVYAIALAMFSTDGFINTFMAQLGSQADPINFLMQQNGIGVWFQMLAWGVWKGVGWSAIIYIAGISGIDQGLYEAATVDGAGRFQKMWHVSLPGLLPTYFVMLLMSIANILSNGMDQYLVFQNSLNTKSIEVLDLYVYTLGITGGNIPLSTVVGMVKSLVSVILLFAANGISKGIRGESIV